MVMTHSGHFLGVARTLLGRSDAAYQAYIKNGKVFLYAKILKESNDALRELLINNAHLLPMEHARNALALIHHIDVWGAIWEDTYQASQPGLMSVFAFENVVNFPRKEVEMLMDYYKEINPERPSCA